MMRKKIVNKNKFQFREDEVLPPRRVNPKNSFQSRLAGKAYSSPGVAVHSKDHEHERGFVSPKPLIARKKNMNQDVPLAKQVDIGASFNNRGGTRGVVRDSSAPSSLSSFQTRTDDPVLDEIVAKLKSGLQLSNSNHLAGRSNRMARDIETPTKNKQAGLTFKTSPPSLDVEGCVCLRPMKLVMCEVCGETFCGRVSLDCRVHPRALYLQDLKECKGCKQSNKNALKEFDLPEGMEKFVKKVAEKKI